MKLYIIAGEASGDLHGKNLVRALKEKSPGAIEFMGVGGDGLAGEGMRLTRHIRDTNFMGFLTVIKNLDKISRLFRDVKRDILAFKPDAVILIDYPGFNLRIAKFLHKRGIKVLYYISPQVWAWKKSRVKTIEKFVEKMFVILPFERNFYANEGLDVDFVGHPLLDELSNLEFDPVAIRKELGLDDRPVIALLPGSREQEIKRKLPLMVATRAHFPNHQFIIAGALPIDKAIYDKFTGGSIPVAFGKTYEVLTIASLAIVTSGTATLETALFGVPEVVCYSGEAISVLLARWLIKVEYISLVNLVMGRAVVKELIQKDLTTENIVAELNQILNDHAYRDKMMADFKALRKALGNSGASERTAEGILRELGG